MLYDVRIPGYGGAGVFLRRTVELVDPWRGAIDVWLLGPQFCYAVLARPSGDGFFAEFARYLFAAASDALPERTLPAFTDVVAGISVDVAGSSPSRLNLRVAIAEEPDGEMLDPLMLDFDVSRAALADAAYRLAEIAGGTDLADFDGAI